MKTLKFVLGGGVYSSPACEVINLVSEGSVCNASFENPGTESPYSLEPYDDQDLI